MMRGSCHVQLGFTQTKEGEPLLCFWLCMAADTEHTETLLPHPIAEVPWVRRYTVKDASG